jgi:gliding motility-associated-like protein
LTCSSVNVLADDYDIDPGDHITISSYSTTTSNGGSVSQIGDSIFCYTADSSFAGVDTFHYTICDTSNKCTGAYVIVIVPVQARNDEGLTKQDSTIYINVTANDTRTGGEYISLCSQPVHGAIAIDSGNIIQYTPVHDYPVDPITADTNATQNGVDSFCYTLCNILNGDTVCANAEVYVMILPKAAFYIPQGISPNGDGVNDVFVIASANEFPLSQLLVYNRYGDEVWRNDGDGYVNDFNGTWKKNGQPLPDGSYWYIFKFNDGVTSDRMGYIVIQR